MKEKLSKILVNYDNLSKEELLSLLKPICDELENSVFENRLKALIETQNEEELKQILENYKKK